MEEATNNIDQLKKEFREKKEAQIAQFNELMADQRKELSQSQEEPPDFEKKLKQAKRNSLIEEKKPIEDSKTMKRT